MFLIKCFRQLLESYDPFYWHYASGKVIYTIWGKIERAAAVAGVLTSTRLSKLSCTNRETFVLCCAHKQHNAALVRTNTTTQGSCLKTGQHFIFVIIYLLLPINCIIFDSVSKILFSFFIANNNNNYDSNNENIAP